MELKPGIKIHGYTLGEFISSGATAEVWRITDEFDNEKALKIFSPVQKVDNSTLDLLIDEFKLLYRLDHHHILKSEIMGAYQKVPYIIMPYYDNNLAAEMTKRSHQVQSQHFNSWFSEDECVTLMQQIGSGLTYLHQQGILHQDVKPENILFNSKDDPPHYVLTDFGISTKIKENIARMTLPRHQSYALTPAYASPEQFRGRHEFKSDVFSLGVVLFEMCEGRLPFTKHGYVGASNGFSIKPEFRNTHLTVPFKNLILSALAEKPEDRLEASDLEDYAIRSRGNMITEQEKASERSNKITVIQPLSMHSQDAIEISDRVKPEFKSVETNLSARNIKEISEIEFNAPQPIIASPNKKGKIEKKRLIVFAGLLVLLVTSFAVYKIYEEKKINRISSEASQLFINGKISEAGKLYEKIVRMTDRPEYAIKRMETATILSKNYSAIFPFHNNRARVIKDGKWGFIDPSGEIIIPCLFTSADDFIGNVAYVCEAPNQCGIIDAGGNKKTDFVYYGILELGENSSTLTRIINGEKISELKTY